MKKILAGLAILYSLSINAQSFKYPFLVNRDSAVITFDPVNGNPKWTISIESLKRKAASSVTAVLDSFFTAKDFIDAILQLDKKTMNGILTKQSATVTNDLLADIYNKFWADYKKRKAAVRVKKETAQVEVKKADVIMKADTLRSQLIVDINCFIVNIITENGTEFLLQTCTLQIDDPALKDCHAIRIYKAISEEDFIILFKQLLSSYFPKIWKVPANVDKKASGIYKEWQKI